MQAFRSVLPIGERVRSWRVVGCLVGIAVLAMSGVWVEGSALPITVVVRVAAPLGNAPGVAQLFATPSASSAHHAAEPVSVHAVKVPGSTTLQLEAGTDWELTATSPGFWCGTKTLRPSAGASVELLLYPSGFVASRVETAQGIPLPVQILVRLKPGVSSDGTQVAAEPEAEIKCPVTQGAFRCEVPAGFFDLRLGSPGFVPKYLWNTTITPGQTAKLPPTVLRKGSSVSGWVVFAVPAAQRSTCQVELKADATLPPQSRLDEVRRRDLAQLIAVNDRGFFQSGAVQPGRYLVTARAPGLVAADSARIDVSEGMEAQLTNPIRLASPVDLTVVLDPPNSVSGEYWAVLLAREDHQGRELTRVGQTLADRTGRAKFGGLAPGKYQLTVGDHRQQRWLDETLTVEQGMGTQFVSIPVLEVEGTLFLGKTPTDGIVSFRGKGDARHVLCFAREEGRFRCALPGPGSWRVDVQIKGDKARQEVDPVEVAAAPPGGVATVDIVVPDRPLGGRVVDEHGGSVAGARVRFVHLDDMHESTAVANNHGEFELRSVPVGPATVQAMDPRGISETHRLTIEEGATPEESVLTIKPRAVLEGHVVSPFGPVAGALVNALSDLVPGASAMMVPRTTDVDGAFRIESLNQAAGASLLVVPPGFGTRLFRVALDPVAGTTIDVTVDQAVGAITINLGSGATQVSGPSLWLAHDGGAMPLSVLASVGLLRIAASDAGSFATIHSLAPGEYSVCTKYPLFGALGTAGVGPSSSAACASGYLSPGGVLELNVGAPSR